MKQQTKPKNLNSITNEYLAGLGNQNIEHFGKIYESTIKASARMGAETFRFFTKRLEEDIEFPAKLAKCHSSSEFIQTNIRFFEKMLSDYAVEAQSIFGIAGSAARSGYNEIEDMLYIQTSKPNGKNGKKISKSK